MRYFVIGLTALLFVASADSAAIGAKKRQARRGARGNDREAASSEIQMPPVCGARQRECGPCHSYPSCTGCGGCGSGGVGPMEVIDIDSLTPVAQSKMLFERSQVRIVVELPEDCGVYLLGRQMLTSGEKRSFLVSVPDAKKVYEYEITVDAVRGGKKYFKKIKVKDFRAGLILAVKVESPKIADGEPVVLKAEMKVEAPGGPPVDAGGDDKKDDTDIITTQVKAGVGPKQRS